MNWKAFPQLCLMEDFIEHWNNYFLNCLVVSIGEFILGLLFGGEADKLLFYFSCYYFCSGCLLFCMNFGRWVRNLFCFMWVIKILHGEFIAFFLHYFLLLKIYSFIIFLFSLPTTYELFSFLRNWLLFLLIFSIDLLSSTPLISALILICFVLTVDSSCTSFYPCPRVEAYVVHILIFRCFSHAPSILYDSLQGWVFSRSLFFAAPWYSRETVFSFL